MGVICCLASWLWWRVPRNALSTAFLISAGQLFPPRLRPGSDEQAIRITHGYSRPSARLEASRFRTLGVPRWYAPGERKLDGNTSDTQIFKEQAEALMTVASSQRPGISSQMQTVHEDTAPTLASSLYHPHSGTIKLVSQVITQALQEDRWHRLDGRPAMTVWSCVTTAGPTGWWSVAGRHGACRGEHHQSAAA
jgi:hypothetical protein